MHSSSCCGGGCIHYEMDIICPSCRRLSKSHDNRRKLFSKYSQCGKFIIWAEPMQDGQRSEDEKRNQGSMSWCMN